MLDEIDQTTDEARKRELRSQLIEVNMPVAASIARRYFRRGEPDEDLVQTAYIGLSKAAVRFNSALGKDFLSYAVPTITGELKKHFRDHCWTVRPSRRIQELQTHMSQVRESLTQRLGRTPHAPDFAAEIGVPESEVAEALVADGCFMPDSLDAVVSDEIPASLGDLLGDRDPGYERCEGHILIANLLGELDTRQREILQLRYVNGWTQDRIGNHLGVSQMQVSRVLGRIIRDLGDKAAA